MKGDFTRITFDPGKHYAAVMKQQGRVDLDADWNEQDAIQRHLHEVAARDMIGPCGVPEPGGGFAVTANGGGLRIAAGRFYVDGILCENDADTTVADQPELPAGLPFARLPDGTWTAQPPAGRYLAYLDVWHRLVTALEDPGMRELALGGPDTAVRLKTSWQVRLLRTGDVGSGSTCLSPSPAWEALVAGPDGTLAARTASSPDPANPCVVPATAGYRRLENHLYRIEIHDGGQAGTATFTWSRNNAFFATTWLQRNGNLLTVASRGRDTLTGIRNLQWVELTDDRHVLSGRPGTLVRVLEVKGNTLLVDPATATDTLDMAEFPLRPRVRPWDGDGRIAVAVPTTNDGFVAIEDGIEVRFSAGQSYRTGDHWYIPARTADGIEWPQSGGAPAARRPHGTKHHFCRLAVVEFDGATWTLVSDCRPAFPALTNLTSLFYVGGDGQEVPPDPTNPATLVQLPRQLRVGVARGTTAVAGARVRFGVTVGNGRLDGNAQTSIVLTDAAGIAATGWSLDSGNAAQEVVAELVDVLDQPRHLAVRFGGRLSTAALTSFDPANCPPLAGQVTVQRAIEQLCRLETTGCATYVLAPEGDWTRVLRELRPGEHAHICFQRGDYRTEETVRVRGAGNLVFTGAGAGTRILARGTATALQFVDCASVTLRNLAVAASDEGVRPRTPMDGAVAVDNTPLTVADGVAIACGSNAETERSCLSVRSREPGTGGERDSAAAVRVRNSRLLAGDRQVGLYVENVGTVAVDGCELRPPPGARAMRFETLLAEPAFRTRLANVLLADAITSDAEATPGRVTLEAGRFNLVFNTSVPTAEWRALMRAEPPAAAELADPVAAKAYGERLLRIAVDNPERLRTFDEHLGRIRRSVGEAAFERLDPRVRASFLNAGEVEVQTLSGTEGAERTNVLSLGEARVRFDSPVSDADWQALLRAGPPPRVRNSEELRAHLGQLAELAIADANIRARVPGVREWFERLRLSDAAILEAAILCRGGGLAELTVRDCIVVDAFTGIDVGRELRDPRGTGERIASAQVADNRIGLRLPRDRARGGAAVTVLNPERSHVENNDLQVAGDVSARNNWRSGIVLAGSLGGFALVRENSIRGCATGIRIQPVNDIGNLRVQWLVGDNWLVGADPRVDIVVPPQARLLSNVSTPTAP
ncbi:MAG: hypothetical protein IPK26_05925 [Planctomycetes bacterium]|nr:hypothetical protein [Planctomycetota bacterium]